MGLQGLVRQIKGALASAGVVDGDADSLIDAFLNETRNGHDFGLNPRDYHAGHAVVDAPPETQMAVLTRLCDRMTAEANYKIVGRLESLASALFARALPFRDHDLERLLAAALPKNDRARFSAYRRWSAVVRVVRRYLDAGHVLTPAMRAPLEQVRDGLKNSTPTEDRRLRETLNALLGDSDPGLPDPGEAWADSARTHIEALTPGARTAWESLLAHAATADGAKPSAKWLDRAAQNRQAVGDQEFSLRAAAWLSLAAPPPPFTESAPRLPDMTGATLNFYKTRAYADYQAAHQKHYARVREYLNSISEKNISLLKGLAWYAADCADPALARALVHLTEAAFENVRERGAWAKSAGNAAIWALGQMPGGVGVGPLARLRTRLRDRGALKLIASSIEAAAKNAGMTVDELEDLAVPTGGLDADGARRETFGEDGAATLTLDAKSAKTNLAWFGADGKPRKAVPAALKTNHAAEVKALKAAEDEIKQALAAQSARFDRFLLDERTWTLAQWRERYLAHPILGNLARRLIWTFDGTPGLPTGDGLVDADGQELAGLTDETPVRLWHPIADTPPNVLRWRDALERRGIVQPFKQAHREIYLLTDAERATRTYSNRFAAHVLKQHQFNSLCVLRGWKNQLRLMVDDSYPPATRELPRYGLRAEFWVEGIGDEYGTDTNDTGTYLRVATDQVRFYPADAPPNFAHAGGGGYSATWRNPPLPALPLDQIPPLVFSEVMRDVDLFVGVASVGNDPTWSDGGPAGRYRDYWRDYAFGDLTESARTRADVLARLLPRLKIAARCRLDGKFLVVCGDLRTYKIHLGSGNILMEPNDQYLCIVPTSRGEDSGDLFLPFEGDRTLAIVLSKAFLLADDTHITDPTITRQLQVQ